METETVVETETIVQTETVVETETITETVIEEVPVESGMISTMSIGALAAAVLLFSAAILASPQTRSFRNKNLARKGSIL